LISSTLAFILLFVKTKVSIHMIGISALTTFLIGLSIHYHDNKIYLISLLLFLNGVIASSRLEMKAHNQKELIIGFSLGVIPQSLLLLFWL
jgi:membrane-associated phospholipid phosphatase